MQSINNNTLANEELENYECKFEPFCFFDDIMFQICKSYGWDYSYTMKDLEEIKNSILESKDNAKINATIRYFETNKLTRNAKRNGLIDLIIFSLRNNLQLIFKNDFKYLNLVFSRLIILKHKTTPNICINNYLDVCSDLSKPNVKFIQNKILNLNRILYFSIAKTTVYTQKHPPTSVMEMKSLGVADLKTDAKYAAGNELVINHGYDIDGLISPIHFENIGDAIKGEFRLELNLTYTPAHKTLKSNDYHFFYGNNLIPLQQCMTQYLGYYNLPGIGDLKLYLIFPRIVKEKDLRGEKIWESILDLKKGIKSTEPQEIIQTAMRITINETNRTAEGVLSTDLIPFFFERLNLSIGQNTTFFYFAEILGNKKSTVSLSFKTPISNINKYIQLDKLPGLRIDICEESWVNTPHALSLSSNFMSDIGIKSNYNILMCKSLNNAHQRNIKSRCINLKSKIIKNNESDDEIETQSSEDDDDEDSEEFIVPEGKILVNSKGFIEKTNFYSRYEDTLKPIRKDMFYPVMTLKKYDILKSHKSSVSNRKVKEYAAKLETTMRDIDDNHYVSFRKELKIAPIFYMDALSIIHSDKISDYLVVETKDVNKVIRDVTSDYLEALRDVYTPFNIINLLLFEYFFQHLFLKGTKNWHYIKPRLYKFLSNYRNKMIDFTEDPQNNPKIIFNVEETDCDKKYVTELMIRLFYCYQLKLGNSNQKFHEIFETQTIKEGLKLIVETMLKEFKIHLKTPNMNFNADYSRKLLIDEKAINFNIIYNNMFKSDEPYQKKMDYKIMFKIFCDWRDFSSEDIKMEFKNLNILVWPKSSSPSDTLGLMLIDYEDGSNPISRRLARRKIRIKKLQKELLLYTKAGGSEVTEEELIRVMWYEAYKSILNLSWNSIVENFYLGTPFTRPVQTYSEIKKRFNKKAHPRVYVEKLVIQALHYNPKYLSLNEIFKNIESWNIKNNSVKYKCSYKFKELYKHLYYKDGACFELPDPELTLAILNKEFRTDLTRERVEKLKFEYKLDWLENIFEYYENQENNSKSTITEEISSEVEESMEMDSNKKEDLEKSSEVEKTMEKDSNKKEDLEKSSEVEKTMEKDSNKKEDPEQSCFEKTCQVDTNCEDGPDVENYNESIVYSDSLHDSLDLPHYFESLNFDNSYGDDIPFAHSISSIVNDETGFLVNKSKYFNFGDEWIAKNFIERFNLIFDEDHFELNSKLQTPNSSIMYNGSFNTVEDSLHIEDNNNIRVQFNYGQAVVDMMGIELEQKNKELALLKANTKLIEKKKKLSIKMNGIDIDLYWFDFLPSGSDVFDFVARFEKTIKKGENSMINSSELTSGLFSGTTRPKLVIWKRFINFLAKKKVIQLSKKGNSHTVSMF